jgi:hypothetical protein
MDSSYFHQRNGRNMWHAYLTEQTNSVLTTKEVQENSGHISDKNNIYISEEINDDGITTQSSCISNHAYCHALVTVDGYWIDNWIYYNCTLKCNTTESLRTPSVLKFTAEYITTIPQPS